jgi:hypothetical protein
MIKYVERQTLKNIITGKEMKSGELDYAWQEFVSSRQDSFNKNNESLEKIEGLLTKFTENQSTEEVIDAMIDRENDVSFDRYSKGFIDGIKMAIKLGVI